MFGDHACDTRQPVIIRLLGGACCFLAAAGAGTASGQEPARASASACISCVLLHVPALSASSLEVPGETLAGLIIVVDALEPQAGPALERLADAGALPGLIASVGAPAPAAEVMRQARVLIVSGVSDADESVFALRMLSTQARGLRPDVRILLAGAPPLGRLGGYVDGVVARGPHFSRPGAEALAVASQQGGAGPRLVRVTDVDWEQLSLFASQRAFGTEVVGAAELTVDQVIARHQAQRRRQDALVRRTIAHGSTTLLFEVPGFVAPVTITSETVVYRQPGSTEVEQRNIRVNGAAVAGGNAASPPRLPLIEPERVAVPPLTITLDDAYVYELLGREETAAHDAYLVRFEPRRGGPGLAQGRAWIDAATFALRRLETIQSGLRGAIVSSEQHDDFAPFHTQGEDVWLAVRTRVYQMYEGAGHRTPIHRTVETPEYAIDPEDFEARLRAAYASPHVMLRETPQGFRYLLRETAAADDASAREVAPRAGERIRTAVFGVLVDPNITVPLPFAGFSYVDLNVLDTGAQLNAFFGGSYGQLSWSVPSLGGTRWQAHGRAFGIAARYNDRSFRSGIERYDENVTQRPAHLSAGVVRPLRERLRMRLAYELDYTAFGRAETTAPTFRVPTDSVVHGLMAAVEAESGPWSARAWWSPAIRQHWRSWGEAGAGEDPGIEDARTFQRVGTSVSRTLAVGRRVASRVEAAWMAGSDLDRFSRYSFGAFDNRLHGYPTASLRYDRGGVVRTVTSWSARGWRIDGFGDLAVVRDPGFGARPRTYPGVGAAVEVAGPFRTLWSAEWGYGFRALRSDGEYGTQAVRVTGYRTF